MRFLADVQDAYRRLESISYQSNGRVNDITRKIILDTSYILSRALYMAQIEFFCIAIRKSLMFIL